MTPKVVIVGAGGTGRELAALISATCNLRGFLDDRETGPDILGETTLIQSLARDHLLAGAIGSFRSMDARRRILSGIAPHATFSFIHSRAFVYPGAGTGNGHLIFPGAIVTTGVELGDHVLIYHNSVVSHDTRIGSFSVIANGAVISGGAVIGEGSYIGSGATIIEGCRIGSHCIIAAGSTVISDVPDNTTWIGPGRMIPNKYHQP